MRATNRWGLAAVLALTLAVTGLAPASTPKQTTIAKTPSSTAPNVYIDKHGTTLVFWRAQAPGKVTTILHLARKTAGSKSFRTSKLPNTPDYTSGPFVYETATGTLRVIVDTTGTLTIWQSKNDGASWKIVDTKALNALRAQSIYLSAGQFVDAKGGPIAYTGSNGGTGAIVQLKPDLSGVTTLLTTTQPLGADRVARSISGTVFDAGTPVATGIPFQAGSATGLARFPVCKGAAAVANEAFAAGRSVAVIAVAACGKVHTRTISASGKVGPLKTLGTVAVNSANINVFGFAGPGGVTVVADRKGNLTAAYVAPGGDLRIAHSTDGSHWKTAGGSVPVASPLQTFGSQAVLSGGTTTYYGATTALGNNLPYAVSLLKLTDTYRAPTPPSGRGIPSPKHAVLGSLAVTVPGRIPLKSFRKNGKVTLRLTDVIPDTIVGSVSLTRVKGNTTFDICQGGGKSRLQAGHARTVTYGCGSSAITIGAAVQSRGVDAHRGDTVTFTFGGRNGGLTVVSKVG